MPPRACNPPKPLSTHCHMLHSRQCRRAATTPISRMDDTRHSNPDAMRWRIPSCDPGHDVRDPQPDRDRVVGPSAGGQPGLRDRGHSETAIDIGADLPFVEHRCPRIPEMDCTDDPAPVADHVPARTGSYKCRMHRGNGDMRPKTRQGQSTAVPAGTVPWAAARQLRRQLAHSAPSPIKGQRTQSPTGRGWQLCPEPC